MSERTRSLACVLLLCLSIIAFVAYCKGIGPFAPPVKIETPVVNQALLQNPFDKEPEGYWLRIFKLDGSPATGYPPPDEIYLQSTARPIVEDFKNGYWRITFDIRPIGHRPPPKR